MIPLHSLLVFLGSWLGLWLCLPVSAVTINRVNGSANVVYVDFSVPGTSIPLELVRSYNSITALSENSGWSGSFGWGWTSPIETTLTVTPEKNVILRDGGTGNNIVFRALKEDPKALSSFIENLKKAYFEEKKKRKISASELAKLELPDKMQARLKTEARFRAELASRYGISNSAPTGKLISSEYGYQTLQFQDNQWTREKDGITQVFDKEGRLSRQVDKNGVVFDFKYQGANRLQVTEIHDQDKATSLKVTWQGDRVTEVVDNRGWKSRYQYDGIGNLSQVTDSHNQTYGYKYENKKFPHLLTKIDYVSEFNGTQKPSRELSYDDTGLVTFHKDKDGTETSYSYGRNPSNPDSNFWTKWVKKSGGNTEEQYEEFLLKSRADGTKYLYKQDMRQGNNSTTTIFTACCGKPAQIVKNGEVTNFKYSEDGLLKEKTGPGDNVALEYDSRWKKVSKVTQNGLTSQYEYDNRGNLVRAYNSKKQKVTLSYDRSGRITEMLDPDGRRISFKYGPHGKPVLIAEKGVGSIRIDYDPNGRIIRTETAFKPGKDRRPTQAKSQEVIRRVMKGFQYLLDIIRPAGLSLSTVTNL